MSVKRTRAVTVSESESTAGSGRRQIRVPKWVWILVVAAAGLGFYWYKTNTWPIVAMVGWRPVTRHEISQSLFARGGEAEIENRITEIQVELELNKLGVKVTDAEIDSRIEEDKQMLGEGVELEAVLESRGMSLSDYREWLRLVLGAEKAVADRVTVTDEEVQQFLVIVGGSATDSAAMAEAREEVRMNKISQEITTWLKGLTDKYKVWKAPGM